MLVNKVNVLDCTYWIPFPNARAKKAFFGPQTLSKGAIFGRKQFWSKYRHVGCSDCRNRILWWFWAITAHFEPSRWRNRPKTSFWGLLEAKNTLLGSLGAQKRPDTRSKCLVTVIPTHSDQSAAAGTKSNPPGPCESLWGPKKGLFGQKRALLEVLGAQKRPDTRSKCLVTMIPTQSSQSAAVGTKSGSSGVLRSFSPSQGLFEVKWALLGPPWVHKRLHRGPTWLIIM